MWDFTIHWHLHLLYYLRLFHLRLSYLHHYLLGHLPLSCAPQLLLGQPLPVPLYHCLMPLQHHLPAKVEPVWVSWYTSEDGY